MYLFAILFLPGTFIHEISHFLAALFLLVPVGKLKLIPEFKEDGEGIDLGSVSIAKTDPLRRFLIGVAPFTFGIFLIFAILFLITTDRFVTSWWGNVLAGILIFETANSMFVSKKDLDGAAILLIFIVIAIGFLYVWDVKVLVNPADLALCKSVTEILKKASIFFLVPIFIDTVVLLTLKRI